MEMDIRGFRLLTGACFGENQRFPAKNILSVGHIHQDHSFLYHREECLDRTKPVHKGVLLMIFVRPYCRMFLIVCSIWMMANFRATLYGETPSLRTMSAEDFLKIVWVEDTVISPNGKWVLFRAERRVL